MVVPNMFAVSVIFTIAPEHADAFQKLICQHAARTLELETGCHRFDVGFDEANACRVFLYELYENQQAFDQHCQSDYLAAFFETAGEWIKDKEVNRWKVEPTGGT